MSFVVIEKSRFIKEQESSEILRNLGLKVPLSKIPLLGPILFERYKMNEIINRFLLARDKFMSEMYLRQPGLIYSACGPFTEKKEQIQTFKEIGDLKYIYQNKLDKACFQNDLNYEDF